MIDSLKAQLAIRDALFHNPRAVNARTWWESQGLPEPVHPDVPLMATHKARLQWLDATDEMLAESIKWLTDRGYETTMHGAPPLTPEARDMQRMALGWEPLNSGE